MKGLRDIIVKFDRLIESTSKQTSKEVCVEDWVLRIDCYFSEGVSKTSSGSMMRQTSSRNQRDIHSRVYSSGMTLPTPSMLSWHWEDLRQSRVTNSHWFAGTLPLFLPNFTDDLRSLADKVTFWCCLWTFLKKRIDSLTAYLQFSCSCLCFTFSRICFFIWYFQVTFESKRNIDWLLNLLHFPLEDGKTTCLEWLGRISWETKDAWVF